jgi:late competence protein required for DNA uptake (superfamily II DNA/RNA helicase)
MPRAQLEEVMQRFLEGERHILVTTAIIENGLDVPTANTLIVDRADYFGLRSSTRCAAASADRTTAPTATSSCPKG